MWMQNNCNIFVKAGFAQLLPTFPLSAEPVKVAALDAYRDVERGLGK